MNVYARLDVGSAIRQGEAEVTAALVALDGGQIEDVRSRLLGALMSLADAAKALART